MTGIVYDWWMGPSEEERRAVMEARLSTLELLLKTQFVPEPVDEKKQLITYLSRMELKDLKYFDQFSKDFMAKVFKANLSNDVAQKISFFFKITRKSRRPHYERSRCTEQKTRSSLLG